jgi:hypothetical protein
MVKHIKQWNRWRKEYKTNLWHSLLVLIGIRHDITVDIVLTDEEKMTLSKSLTED